MKVNRLFVVDLLLLIFFILTAASGFGMHIAGHGTSHDIWHGWAAAHILSTLLFVIITIAHIYLHWRWYKTLFTKAFGSKSKVTVVVSVLFVILTISGILSLFPSGPNSNIGITHYKIGVISTLLFAGHIIKRIKILIKGLLK